MQTCLIDELRKLKESSKEAVEGLDSFDDFKEYMHIHRDVEEIFSNFLIQSASNSKSQLVLLCGGVGVGKSHIVSHQKNHNPELISKFDLHNDATESFKPKGTAMETLNQVLDDFSDEKLQRSHKKLILAINLGTLSNFINSQYHGRFKKLKEYVEDKKILDPIIMDNSYDEESHFQFLNLTDYHLFSLTKNGPKSDYIKELFTRITQARESNPFYYAYQKSCLCSCAYANSCPVKFNYELFREDSVQEKLIQLIIEGILKQKLIISTRSLLNFIFDILVSSEMDELLSTGKTHSLENLKIENFIRNITPTIIFEQQDASNILEAFHHLDPLNTRTEELDNLLIRLSTAGDIASIFQKHIMLERLSYLKQFFTPDLFKALKHNKVLRENLSKLFVRLYKFCPTEERTALEDPTYRRYVQDLFYSNIEDKYQLQPIYTDVKEAIYKWHGECEKNYISLLLSKQQLNYRVIQQLELAAHVSDLQIRNEEELDKFIPIILLKFKKKGREGSIIEIPIDFSLYQLLLRVKDGYKANKKDKNNFINFVQFIEKVMALGKQDKELIFEEKNCQDHAKFKLIYDEEFENYKFERV